MITFEYDEVEVRADHIQVGDEEWEFSIRDEETFNPIDTKDWDVEKWDDFEETYWRKLAEFQSLTVNKKALVQSAF